MPDATAIDGESLRRADELMGGGAIENANYATCDGLRTLLGGVVGVGSAMRSERAASN
jgi:hypothetical protein